jgi:hypothetical protein|tara:strand:- start:70943 stop:71122 length:180 start_codon:yes stop_codon:yes gene_type:complete
MVVAFFDYHEARQQSIDAFYQIAGIAQLVERNLAKVEVAGSNPVSRSIISNCFNDSIES